MLQSMRDKYPESKIKMMTIFPGDSSLDMLKKVYGERWGITQIPAFTDNDMKLFEAFDIEGVPFSVIIDKTGKPGASFLGMPAKADVQKAMDAAIAAK